MGGKLLLFLLSLSLVQSHAASGNVIQYDTDLPDLKTICANFRTAINVSELCGEQLEIVCDDIPLLLTMLDASAKPVYAGWGYASRIDYGYYDECMTIDYRYGDGGRILGEHCTVGLVIPDISDASNTDLYFKLGICRPNGCSAADYNQVLFQIVNNSDLALFQDLMCQTIETYATYETGDIVVMSLFSFIIFLMVLSTLYDLYQKKNGSTSAHPLLLAFSIYSNGTKLLHISKHSSKERIATFDGLRVISMMWIVAGHGITVYKVIAVTNAGDIGKWMNEMYAFYLTAGPLAVDTFFFMSGFLLAFQYFKQKIGTLKEQVKAVPYAVVHRYLRLTPAILMIYLLVITFFIHLGDGPVWAETSSIKKTCKKAWWKFFLYIQNWYDEAEICLLQTWYLSADMQMFLLSPLLLIPVSLQFKKMGLKVVLIELFIFNIIFTFLPMIMKLVVRDYNNDFATYTRVINYSIGITLGMFMRVEMDKPFLYMIKEKQRSTVNVLAWLVIILGMLATVVCYRDVELHHGYDTNAVFQALMRPAWCVGLSWMTYSCYHGYGGIVNWLLCLPTFQILGRLTYCIYLLHVTVQVFYFAQTRARYYFDDYQAFYFFCGHYMISVILATFWTLAFESPMIIIEKYIFGGGKKPVNKSKPPLNGQSVENAT